VYVETFREPFVERVVATAGDDKPIFSASPIRVLGNRLRGHTTRLVIDGGPDIAPTTTADTELTATLPAALRAGLHGLQVQHRRLMGTPEADHRGVESNIAPFILTPRIKQPGGVYQISLANQISETVDGQVVHSADVTLKIDPDVAKDQRVALLLNEIAATDARTYTFLDEPRALDTDTITVRAVRVKPATYLVRVQVDGADSRLDVTGDTYSDPKVTL
jgi:hypothetical protein